MVHAVTDKNDYDAQLEAAGGKLVIVDFQATWCGPCRTIAPYFEELSKEFGDVVFLSIDIDGDLEDLQQQYDVRGIPTFVFLKNKEKKSSIKSSTGYLHSCN